MERLNKYRSQGEGDQPRDGQQQNSFIMTTKQREKFRRSISRSFSKVIEAEVVQVADPLSKTELSPNGSKAKESSDGRKQSKPSTNASHGSQLIKPGKFILATSGADDKDKVIDF